MASGTSKKKSKSSAKSSHNTLSCQSGNLRRLSSSLKTSSPHKPFKRSYREDYVRELEVPGMMYHILYSFRLLFKNWKIFLPLLLVMVIAAILLAGLMSESVYQQFQTVLDQTAEATGSNIGTFAKSGLLLITTAFTGGFSTSSDMGTGISVILIFLIIWLTTIFILRHLMAGNKITMRDGLYNAMSPLISTFLVLLVALVQLIPIVILIIAYAAAVETDFLATPFYALLFLGFAALMILLSSYLISGTIMALVAVSAPGLYPLVAIKTANDLMIGRRIRFILRIIALIITLIVIWAIVMLPLIMFDLFMKQFDWTLGIPFIPICLVIMTCFSVMYVATFFYTYYRWMLGYDSAKTSSKKTKPTKK